MKRQSPLPLTITWAVTPSSLRVPSIKLFTYAKAIIRRQTNMLFNVLTQLNENPESCLHSLLNG